MHFIILFLFFAIVGIFMPKSYRVFEVLVLAPIVGCAFGGFAWTIGAICFNSLITWTAFGGFLFCGMMLTEIAFAKAH